MNKCKNINLKMMPKFDLIFSEFTKKLFYLEVVSSRLTYRSYYNQPFKVRLLGKFYLQDSLLCEIGFSCLLSNKQLITHLVAVVKNWLFSARPSVTRFR